MLVVPSVVPRTGPEAVMTVADDVRESVVLIGR
jgi:hypothetical protein